MESAKGEVGAVAGTGAAAGASLAGAGSSEGESPVGEGDMLLKAKLKA